MELLYRKVDSYLVDWKKSQSHKPLIIKGARQIGKTASIRHFGQTNYENYIEINFILQHQYKDIFDDGYEIDTIVKNITLKDPTLKFEAGKTLIFFDEIQSCVNAATSLKAFNQDRRYDVICSGSLMGINYQEIESNSVGNKTDFTMHSMDFEEFLYALGYKKEQVEDLFKSMLFVNPLPESTMSAMMEHFREYMVVGGMPEIVATFVSNRNYSGILDMQRQVLIDYEEDITKYAGGLDKTKILNYYRSIPIFLGKDNKKFQISKIAKGARNREYIGVKEWLENAGIILPCYCMSNPELPIKGNYDPNDYKAYYSDIGLLIASLDEEAQQDLRYNKNFNAYKGGIYENVIAESLIKQGYLQLTYYKNVKSTLEIDFITRDSSSIVPIEVKAQDSSTKSLNSLIEKRTYPDVHYGIKLCAKNVGFNGKFFTFPYFLVPFIKEWLARRQESGFVTS